MDYGNKTMDESFKIRVGATRKVYLISKYALKLPHVFSFTHFLIGLLANIDEYENYKLKINDTKEDIARIIYSNKFGLLTIMERGRTCKCRSNKKFKFIMSDIYKDHKEKDFLLEDCRSDNFAWFSNSKIKKIDYTTNTNKILDILPPEEEFLK